MYVTCVNTLHVILLIDDYVMDIYLCYDYVYMDIIWFNGFRCIIHTHHVKVNLIDNLIQNDFKFLKGNVFTPLYVFHNWYQSHVALVFKTNGF